MADTPEREGGDITADDMVEPAMEPSEIQAFYKHAVIFITGVTGFLGKMFLEKFLRTCYDLKKIYVLMREKKGVDIEARFEKMFGSPMFDALKRKRPNFRSKIEVMKGDLELKDLGLSENDKKTFLSEVTCIIHCAATVRFDEPIRRAMNINVRSLRDLIVMAKSMKQLKTFLYTSTAYSNFPQSCIDEKFYEPGIKASKLLNIIDSLDDTYLNQIETILLGKWPNTYVFSKCEAEDIIREEGRNLPITVIRPSIVLSSSKEPVAGWAENVYGPTGIVCGVSVGLIRTFIGDEKIVSDMMPADFVINLSIAASWFTATLKSVNENKESSEERIKFENEIPIFNCVSSPQNPITLSKYFEYAWRHIHDLAPYKLSFWYPNYKLRSSKLTYRIESIFFHYLPGLILDGVLICMGRKPILLNMYKKLDTVAEVTIPFTFREWKFKNDNVQALWRRLRDADRNLFDFNMSNFSWDLYFYTYLKGIRVYIGGDPVETIPAARRKQNMLRIIYYVSTSLLIYITYRLLLLAYMFILGQVA